MRRDHTVTASPGKNNTIDCNTKIGVMKEKNISLTIRNAEPADYHPIIGVLDNWWGGRKMSDMLPKLFFIHFRDTSFVALQDGEIAGFIIGFVSQTSPELAYIHFVGVHPGCRNKGLAKRLYSLFFDTVVEKGCTKVSCVTAPINEGSIAFHRKMGFSMTASDKIINGIPVIEDYDGPGGDRVLFIKSLVG